MGINKFSPDEPRLNDVDTDSDEDPHSDSVGTVRLDGSEKRTKNKKSHRQYGPGATRKYMGSA
eukprot:NODE_10864_length_322_cov_47.150183_g9951_i0.p1 GENE.NODE_10864_length_322_cov_47.150183_g9951_i0~~NODE_10864_length_322_cov_47.150183_g9951_i0.p1  ORF type:complete len:73 (+),score=27.25 NODE_10864_length_322_cov_47.150183_g9951_i0:32-220(+)